MLKQALLMFFMLLFLACSGGTDSIVGQSEQRYTNDDGSLHNSDVNSFKGRKTAPRKCGDLPF